MIRRPTRESSPGQDVLLAERPSEDPLSKRLARGPAPSLLPLALPVHVSLQQLLCQQAPQGAHVHLADVLKLVCVCVADLLGSWG